MLPVEMLELEVGYALVKLVDNREGGEIVKRISGLRRNFAKDMGIILPPVHVRDNLELKPGEYRLLIQGVEVDLPQIMAFMLNCLFVFVNLCLHVSVGFMIFMRFIEFMGFVRFIRFLGCTGFKGFMEFTRYVAIRIEHITS